MGGCLFPSKHNKSNVIGESLLTSLLVLSMIAYYPVLTLLAVADLGSRLVP